MTPSNPSNQKPFILCIKDALGIPHQVAPLNHTHDDTEVLGLRDNINELWHTLSEKADQDSVTDALAEKQAVLTFDTTPTAGSTNPVTSGGVKAALDGKMSAGYIPDRMQATEDAGMVAISLFESPSCGMVARIYIQNEGTEILSAEINAANIANLIRALQDPVTDLGGSGMDDNLATVKAIRNAISGVESGKVGYHVGWNQFTPNFVENNQSKMYVLRNVSDVQKYAHEFILPTTQGLLTFFLSNDRLIAPNEIFAIIANKVGANLYVQVLDKYETYTTERT